MSGGEGNVLEPCQHGRGSFLYPSKLFVQGYLSRGYLS